MSIADTRSRRWFLRTPSGAAGARLFCLPYSGCGASMYRRWPQFVGDLEICPIQLPGRENRLREPAYDTYQELAAALTEVLLPYLDRPFAFFGHCASALPGYETALQLAERDYPVPSRVFVSSQVAPHEGPHGRFLGMSDDGLAAEVRALIVWLGGEPRPDLLELSLEVLRADVEVNKRYRLDEPVRSPCPITALGWRQDVEVPPELMTGWEDCGETVFNVLEGEHYRFMDAPPELLEIFLRDLRPPASPS